MFACFAAVNIRDIYKANMQADAVSDQDEKPILHLVCVYIHSITKSTKAGVYEELSRPHGVMK